MREFLLKLFQSAGGPEIECFSLWHFMYIFLIVGLTIGLAFLLRNKSEKTKKLVVSIIAISAISVYMADFFLMPLARKSGDIDLDKLPFHICTFISIMIPFAQFNSKVTKQSSFKEVVVTLAIVASLMYITYPGSALGGIGTFSYKVVQTFVFHGLVFSWGVLSLTTGSAQLNFKNIWKQAVGIAIIIVWAWFGNIVYSSEARSFDWFFVTGSLLPLHPALMTLVVLVAVFAMCAIIYSIDLGVKAVFKKINAKKENTVNE